MIVVQPSSPRRFGVAVKQASNLRILISYTSLYLKKVSRYIFRAPKNISLTRIDGDSWLLKLKDGKSVESVRIVPDSRIQQGVFLPCRISLLLSKSGFKKLCILSGSLRFGFDYPLKPSDKHKAAQDEKEQMNEVTVQPKALGSFIYNNSHLMRCADSVRLPSHLLQIQADLGSHLNNHPGKSKKALRKEHHPQKTLVFYLDNISSNTARLIKEGSIQAPFMRSLMNSDDFIELKQSMSASNWTQPACVSMFSEKKFEQHKIVNPSVKPIEIQFQMKDGVRRKQAVMDKTGPWTFCGTNWRFDSAYEGFNLIRHSIERPIFSNIYNTTADAYKQIDIFRDVSCVHFISIMDTHHPIDNAPLPGSATHMGANCLETVYAYETGPKSRLNEQQLRSSKEIYFHQISSVDRAIESIVNYAKRSRNDGLPTDINMVFVSDHGTDFLGSSLYEKMEEKFIPFVGFTSNTFDESFIRAAKDVRFSPSKFIGLIEALYSKDLTQITKEDVIYSQIAYPRMPYQLILKVGSKFLVSESIEDTDQFLQNLNLSNLSEGLKFLKCDASNPDLLEPIQDASELLTLKAVTQSVLEQWAAQ